MLLYALAGNMSSVYPTSCHPTEPGSLESETATTNHNAELHDSCPTRKWRSSVTSSHLWTRYLDFWFQMSRVVNRSSTAMWDSTVFHHASVVLNWLIDHIRLTVKVSVFVVWQIEESIHALINFKGSCEMCVWVVLLGRKGWKLLRLSGL